MITASFIDQLYCRNIINRCQFIIKSKHKLPLKVLLNVFNDCHNPIEVRASFDKSVSGVGVRLKLELP
jgi:hypothetical protein